jgi:hypothetical protein
LTDLREIHNLLMLRKVTEKNSATIQMISLKMISEWLNISRQRLQSLCAAWQKFFDGMAGIKSSVLFREYWYPIGLCLFFFPLICAILGVGGFIFHISLSKLHFFIALAANCFLMYFFCRGNIRKTIISYAIFLVLLAVLLVAYSIPMASNTWDSMAYHKSAAILMADGWNPLWNSEDLTAGNGIGRSDPRDIYFKPCVTAFPKVQWIFSAVIYQVVGNFDAGACSNAIFAGIAFAVVSWSITFLFRLTIIERIAAALVIACDTIVITEMVDGMIDGILGSLMTILLFSLAGFVKTRDRRFLPFIAGAVPYIANVKFSGLLNVVIVLAIFGAATATIAWHNRTRIDRALIGTILVSIFLTILIGINPYVTNLVHHGHPLYPFIIDGKFIDPIVDMYLKPPNSFFHGTTASQRFFTSHLIAQNGSCSGIKPSLDFYPIYFLKSNCPTGIPDIGGFGPMFSIALAASLVLIFFVDHRLVLLMAFCVATTIYAMPHSYIARYIPQLWTIPPLVLCAIRSQSREHKIFAFRAGVLYWLIIGYLFVGCFTLIRNQVVCDARESQKNISVTSWLRNASDQTLVEIYDKGLAFYQKRLLLDCSIETPYCIDKSKELCAGQTPCGQLQLMYFYRNTETNGQSPEKSIIPFDFSNALSEICKLRLHQLINAWSK